VAFKTAEIKTLFSLKTQLTKNMEILANRKESPALAGFAGGLLRYFFGFKRTSQKKQVIYLTLGQIFIKLFFYRGYYQFNCLSNLGIFFFIYLEGNFI
jgi:hypothetical protein